MGQAVGRGADQEEAMTIADRMAIFQDGRIVQVGTPEQVFNRPSTMDVAAFIGSPPMNLLPARLDGAGIEIFGHRVELADVPSLPPGDVVAGIRPSHVRLSDSGMPSRLVLSENLGESMLLNLEAGDSLIKVWLPEVRHFAAGEILHLTFEPDHIHLFDPASRRRIPLAK